MLTCLRWILGGTLTLTVLVALAASASTILLVGVPNGPWQGLEGELPGRSPFTAVRWAGDVPEVEVDGRFFELVSIDGTEAAELVRFSQDVYGSRWKKRFSEDLVEVLARLGRPAFFEVDLELRDLASGELETRRRVSMTSEKRGRVWLANHVRTPGPLDPIAVASGLRSGAVELAADGVDPVSRASRAHATTVPAELRELFAMLMPDEAWSSTTLSRVQAEEDLDQLEHLLEERFSYLERMGVDYRAALDAVRLGLGDAVDRNAFTIQVMKVLALFGDGHTRVDESLTRTLPPGYLPFLVGDSGGRPVAFRADRTALVSAEHPFLRSIDGLSIDVWLARAAGIVPDGSPQFARRGAMRTLRYVGYLRRELLMANRPTVSVVLEDESGEDTLELELDLSSRKLDYADWPRRESGVLDGNVGYLRIARMDDTAVSIAELHATMERLRETDGLVIDVRGNGGGTRDATIALLPYFCGEDEAPIVVNAAYYRLPSGEEANPSGGYLADRHLFTPDHAGWSRTVRRAAASFVRRFRPEWEPGAGFVGPYVFVIDEDERCYPYSKPVVVLSNADCYSATDIFLGAFAELDAVTILGTASGGGSGRSRPARLAHSGIGLRLSSMASFQPDGRLYDGRGVEPDVVVATAPTDHTLATDTVLDAALAFLRRR